MGKINIRAKLENITRNIDKSISYTFKQYGEVDGGVDKIINSLTNLQSRANDGLKIDVSKWTEQRTLDANAYCWVLCEKMAKVLDSTKEEIYKQFIRSVGVSVIVPIENAKVDRYVEMWGKQGLGWFCDIIGNSKIDGYTNLTQYYGSSVYNKSEMHRLIDDIIFEAKELGIETRTPAQIEEMMRLIKG